MSDTIDIPVNEDTWVSVADSSQGFITNGSQSGVFYREASSEPSPSTEGHLLRPEDYINYNLNPGQQLWVIVKTGDGTILVTPDSSLGKDPLNLLPSTGAFGELEVESLETVHQISAEHGFIQKAFIVEALGGVASDTDNFFSVSSGTNPAGIAVILALIPVPSRAGQGKVCKLSTVFDIPAIDNDQHGGFISATDALSFSFKNDVFGVRRLSGGKDEIQELQITTPASGSEDATITVDGTPYTVPLTSGTVEHNAIEIANSLTVQAMPFEFTATGDLVVALQGLAAPAGSFAFTSSTAIASWTQITAGVAPDDEFIPRNLWDFNPSSFDPLKGNEYKIQYDGSFGGAIFSIKDPATKAYTIVHIIQHNDPDTTLLDSPQMRAGWFTVNRGNTTNVVLKGASCGLFIEGKSTATNDTDSDGNTNIDIGVTNFKNIITFRNRIAFKGKRNLTSSRPLNLSFTTTTAKSVTVQVVRNAIPVGDLVFSYVDEENSVLESAKDDVVMNGGKVIIQTTFSTGVPLVLSPELLKGLILPGGQVTIRAKLSGTPNSSVSADLVAQDDL